MKAILVVMNTTELVVEIRPEKKFKPVRDLNPWSPITSHDLWVQISYGPEFFFFFFIHICEDRFYIRFFYRSSHIYDFHVFAVIYNLQSLK